MTRTVTLDGLLDAGALTADPVAPPPVLAGRYRVLGRIGAGGMGEVYRARDEVLDEVVAIKVLRPERAHLAAARDAFRREVRLARRIAHPNVVRTHDLGEEDGALFLTMEYVEGRSLRAHLAEGPLTPLSAVRVLRPVAAALAAAHAAGVLHCDLKPDNVLLAADGRVAVADFGIARALWAARADVVAGTPPYLSPEAVAREPLDGRADMYALGILAFELLAGRVPSSAGDDPRAVADVSDALADWIRRCSAPRPADRFADLDECARVLVGADPRRPGRDPATTDLLARAVEAMRKGWDGDLSGALAFAELAAERSPDDAEVLAVLSRIQARRAFYMGWFGDVDPAGPERAQRTAERAVALAPDLGDAWSALAHVALYRCDTDMFASAVVRACALDRRNAKARQLLGDALLEVGEIDRAEAFLAAALAIDPFLRQAALDLGRAAAFRGDRARVEALGREAWAEGEEEVNRRAEVVRYRLWLGLGADEQDVGPPGRGASAALRANTDFLRLLQKASRGERLDDAEVAENRAVLGLPLPRARASSCQMAAELCSAGGRPEVAREALAASVEAGLWDLRWMEACPLIGPLRTDPEWPRWEARVRARATRLRSALLAAMESTGVWIG